MKIAIYARVSSEDQDCQIQLENTREHARRWGWEPTEYVEKLSGKEGNRRPQLEKLLADARRREFDIVLVWKMDRFGRSTLDTLTNVKQLEACGVRFVSIYDNIDTTDKSPIGKFTMTIFAAVAELERGFIVERTQSGFKKYREAHKAGGQVFAKFIAARGRQSKSKKNLAVGRPRCVVDRQRALDLKSRGLSIREIASKLGIGRGTAERLLKASQKPV